MGQAGRHSSSSGVKSAPRFHPPPPSRRPSWRCLTLTYHLAGSVCAFLIVSFLFHSVVFLIVPQMCALNSLPAF